MDDGIIQEELVPNVELTEGTNYVTLAKHTNNRDAIRAIVEVTKDANNNRSYVVIQNIQFRSDYAGTGTWTARGDISAYVYYGDDEEVVEEVTLADFEYSDEWFQASNSSTWVTLGYGKYAASYVDHKSDGRKQMNIAISANTSPHKFTTAGVNGSPTYAFQCITIICQMPDIDRTVPTITASASASSSGSVTLTANANVSCGSWAYKIDNGDWNGLSGTGTSKSVTIPGMTGAHSFQIKANNSANGITGYSNAVSTTTPTLSLSSTAVTTSGSLTVTVQYLPANTYIYLKYGNTVLASYRESSAQTSKVINLAAADLKALFEASGVTTQSSITVTASVDGYSYTATSFTLSSGSNMSPTVGTPTATIVQGSTVDSSLANVYIAGISKVKIAANVTSGSGSSISSVRLSYGSNSQAMSYNSSTGKYEATTSGPITGNTTFTVTATDARGLTGSIIYSLTGVKSWTEPFVSFNTSNTYRCNSSGTKTEGGAYVRVQVTASYSTGISGNALRDLYFYIKEDGASTTHNLTNGVQSTAYALGSPRPDSTITVVVKCRDKVGEFVTRELQLSGAHRDFAIANFYSTAAGERLTAIGVGMAPEVSANMMNDTIQLPENGEVLIGGVPLGSLLSVDGITEDGSQFGKDLLNVDFINRYSARNATVFFYKPGSDSEWSNLPAEIVGVPIDCIREVFWIKPRRVLVRITECWPTSGVVWTNYYTVNSWTGWQRNS